MLRSICSFITLLLIANTLVAQSDSAYVEQSAKQKQLADYRQAFWNNPPNPIGWLNDFDNVFTTSQGKTLDSLLNELNKEKLAQFAVVTLDSICVSADDFEKLTLKLANTWGVGEKGKNNGIMISICKGHRKLRIDNGDGIVKVISDTDTKEVMDILMIPGFKRNEYYEATLVTVLELNRLLHARMK